MVGVSRKHVWWALAAATSLVLVLFAGAAFALRAGALKPRVIRALAEALNCDVTLDQLDVQLVPVIKIVGDGLSVRLHGHPELPPYIEVTRFTVNVGLLSIYRRHVDTVVLDGLRFNVPPTLTQNDAAGATPASPAARAGRPLFSVNHLVAPEATVNFVGKVANSRPLSFAVHNLDVRNAGIDRAANFTASVANPIPEGLVKVAGTFGPWNRDNPPQTPMGGTYDLPEGDLGSINGIFGRVQSAGAFSGQLADIHVKGTSRTPDFSLDLGGAPVQLDTKFVVTVNGTTGTTSLDRVDAMLITTPLIVTGAFTNLPGDGNHDVTLAVEVTEGRIEDLLRLAINTQKPVLIGDISLKATVQLPPGVGTARHRLYAAGTFGFGRARFTDKDVQGKLKELSRRGQGKNQDEVISRVATSVSGTFSLMRGLLTFPRVEFAVPGAAIKLTGTYVMGTEALNFTGTARLAVSLSRAVGGFKSIFIKPFNPFFRKNGDGAVIPIAITGTRGQPQFKLRLKQVFKKEK